MQNKIIPSLWFAKTGGDVAQIVTYYQNVFGGDFEAGQVMDMGETPSGKTQLCQVKIFGQRYSLMSTEKEQADFNDAFALTIECDNQEEIDDPLFYNCLADTFNDSDSEEYDRNKILERSTPSNEKFEEFRDAVNCLVPPKVPNL